MRRNYTEDEFNALRQRIKGALHRRPETVGEKRSKRNKYGSTPTVLDGIRFDSKSEAKRFAQLKIMEKAGEIRDLKIQVPFDLVPALKVDGAKENPVKYIADFTYTDKGGKFVCEDVKSGPTKTKEFVIKRKLLLWLHGIAVREVLMDL